MSVQNNFTTSLEVSLSPSQTLVFNPSKSRRPSQGQTTGSQSGGPAGGEERRSLPTLLSGRPTSEVAEAKLKLSLRKAPYKATRLSCLVQQKGAEILSV